MKIGLVLTGGSLRGICGEIGILKSLEEYNIKPDVIIGTSAGALVGGMYASGLTPNQIIEHFKQMKKKDYIDVDWLGLIKLLTFGKWTGFIKGRALHSWLLKVIGNKSLENTNIKCYITTTNLSKGIPEVHEKGNLPALIRASTAIPFVFRPQEIVAQEGLQYHVDGGAVNNVPLDELIDRAPDCDIYIIGTVLRLQKTPKIDNSFIHGRFTLFGLFERIANAVAAEQKKENLESQDKRVFVILANPGSISLTEPEKAPEAIWRGWHSTITQVKDLAKLIAEIQMEKLQ